MTMLGRCLCCRADKDPGKYLCWDCWQRIPAGEKVKLGKRDSLSGVRLLEMNRQFSRSVPPEEIKVSA